MHATLVLEKIFGIPEGARALSVVMVALMTLGFRGIVGFKMLPAALSAYGPVTHILPDVPERWFVPVSFLADTANK